MPVPSAKRLRRPERRLGERVDVFHPIREIGRVRTRDANDVGFDP
jgi:hypothetical protein